MTDAFSESWLAAPVALKPAEHHKELPLLFLLISMNSSINGSSTTIPLQFLLFPLLPGLLLEQCHCSVKRLSEAQALSQAERLASYHRAGTPSP